MPLQREVIVTIDEDGGVELEVKGVKGPSCRDLTAAVEKALGKVLATKPTAEAAQTAKTAQTVSQKRGG